jgi:predicted kinase
MEKNKKFVMMIGLPGCGKSKISNMFHYYKISRDAILEEIAENKGISYNEAFNNYIDDAKKEYLKQIQDAINWNVNILIDETNLKIETRKHILDMVPSHYEKIACIVTTDYDTMINRINNRPNKFIPKEVIDKMAKEFYNSDVCIHSLQKEGFDIVMQVST